MCNVPSSAGMSSAHPPIPNSLHMCVKNNYLMTYFLLAPCDCTNIMAYTYVLPFFPKKMPLYIALTLKAGSA